VRQPASKSAFAHLDVLDELLSSCEFPPLVLACLEARITSVRVLEVPPERLDR
jgi:hypothetical protein